MIPDPNRRSKILSATIAGWLFVVAGSVGVAGSFATGNPMLAVGALFFFIGAIVNFLKASSLRRK